MIYSWTNIKPRLENNQIYKWVKPSIFFFVPALKTNLKDFSICVSPGETHPVIAEAITYILSESSMVHELLSFVACIIVKALPATECSIYSATAKENNDQPIPMLSSLEQISANQIQISYDREVDVSKGTKTTNYWVQDTMNLIPKGIATLGKNESVNANNSLTDRLVKIQQKDGSAKTFILTFNKNITRGGKYKLIICYVTVPGAPPYSGDNGKMTFVGK